jgi:hypothetical protein
MKIGTIIFLIFIATLVFGATIPYGISKVFSWLAWLFDKIGDLLNSISWLQKLFK